MVFKKGFPYVVLVAVTFFFSSNVIIGKFLSQEIAPNAIAFWRWLFALILAVGVILGSGLRIQKSEFKAIVRNAPFLMFMGFLGMSFCGSAVYYAAHFTTASNIGLVYASSPIFVAILSIFLGFEKNKILTWVGFLIAFIGVFEVISRGEMREALHHLELNQGDLWVLASALAWAFYSIYSRKKIQELPEKIKFICFCFFGTLFLLPLSAFVDSPLRFVPSSSFIWGLLVFMGCVPSFLAFKGYEWVQKKLGLISASTILLITPFSNCLLAFLFLDEALKGFHILGGVLIVAGVSLILFKKEKA